MTTWLVVGLGNPGPTYASTWHNAGRMVVGELATRARVGFTSQRLMRADVAETRITPNGIGTLGATSDKVVLLKTRTFMNESGLAVARAAAFFKLPVDQIVAVHDELDLDLGQLRLKRGGGDNGHNGLKSIRASFSSGDFYRVRLGIGRPPGRQSAADYVLAPIPSAFREDFAVDVRRAADAVETLLIEGLAIAQNRFNS